MILGVIAVIIFLSVLILIHELGHFIAAKKFGLLVEEFGFGLPPRAWGKKIGETMYSINWLPIGGFVKIFGEDESEKTTTRAFASLKIWQRATIIVAGVVMNFVLGWFLLSAVFAVGLPQAVFVTDVQENSPAAVVGIKAGDRIVSVEAFGEALDLTEAETYSIGDFISFVDGHQGEEVTVVVQRGGGEQMFMVTPRVDPPEGQGAIGIGLVESGAPRQGIGVSLWEGLQASFAIVVLVLTTIWQLIQALFTGQNDVLETVAGPVGIVSVSAQASNVGFVYLVQLVGLISLNLAVLNILPFPALDGGRLFFLMIEKLKGSPLPVKFERYANAAGMALLLLLMVLITIQDIGRFF